MARWTVKQINFLHANVNSMSNREIGLRIGKTEKQVKSQIGNMKIYRKKFRFTEGMLQTLIAQYPHKSAAELAKEFSCHINSVHKKAAELGLKKSKEWIAENARKNMANPEHGGRRTQFRKGQAAHNKGKKQLTTGRMAETQFRKGNLPHTTAAVGTLVIDENGYTKIKIAMPNVWQFYQRYLWEQRTGKKVSPDCAVVFKDGDRKNFDEKNLEMISRAELSRRNRNKFYQYPPEFQQIIRTLGGLKRSINNRKEKENAEK